MAWGENGAGGAAGGNLEAMTIKRKTKWRRAYPLQVVGLLRYYPQTHATRVRGHQVQLHIA